MQRIAPALVMILAAVLYMGTNPFDGQTLAPMDRLVTLKGWSVLEEPVPLRHPARSDVLDYKLPAWKVFKEQWRSGDFPLWNDRSVAGVPGAQLVTRSAFTPAFLAFALVPDDALGFTLSSLVNLLIALFGTYCFLRRLDLASPACVFGAFVFAFSGFHAAWFYWPHVNSAIWIPWLLYAVTAYLDDRDVRRLLVLAASTALLLLGGFPAVAVFGLIAAGVLTVALITARRGSVLDRFMLGWPLAAGVLAGLLLSAFALQPLLEQLAYVSVDYRTGGTTISRSDLWQFLVPGEERYPRPGHSFYLGLPAVLLGVLGSVSLFRREHRGATAFALALLAGSVVIVFALVPKDWIRALPGFDVIGSWTRMSVLFGISFAVLSATALSLLTGRMKRAPALGLAIVGGLLVSQFVMQKNYFHRFNGPVPSESFLPATDSLDLAKSSLGPLQSVIADGKIYAVSGILGAYGIPEWFAHDFKSSAEKTALSRILGGAFVTPTATLADCNYLRGSARELALFGIRTLLCPPAAGRGRGKPRPSVSGPLSDAELVFRFDLDEPVTLDALPLRLLRGGGPSPAGDITLRFLHENRVLASSGVPAGSVPRAGWTRFEFPGTPTLPAGHHALHLAWSHPTPGVMFRVGLRSAPPGFSVFLEDRTRQGALLTSRPLAFDLGPDNALEGAFRPSTAERTLADFEEATPERGIRVLVNPETGSSGPYFLTALDPSLAPDFDTVVLRDYRPGRIDIEYRGDDAGWLVLPMRAYPGWEATVDGVGEDTARFLDLMPAVPVRGPARLSYRYAPTEFFSAAAVSALGWLVLLFLAVLLQLRRMRRPAIR